MIKFQRVSKIYYSKIAPVVALSDVSFEIQKGEFVSIVGKSGAGKTTLIRLLVGEEKPTKGSIFFKGKKVNEMSPKEIQYLRRKIGVVYQDYKLLFSKTVKENVEYVMQVIGASDKDIKRDVPQILEIVGLEDKAFHFPSQLSGGEKQRLAIARALCHRPEVLLADEPTGNLDLYNTFEIVKLLKKIHQLGTTVLLATHNKEVVESLKGRVISLDNGKIIYDHKKGEFIL